MAYSSPDIDYRILLIGRTGHGKSSSGNTIVGTNVFKVSDASTSITKTCQWSERVTRFGKTVEVVDTPGIFDTDLNESEVHRELLKALALSTPGFHVIAFVLMKGRFTVELQKTMDIFLRWFGEGVEKFACLILTDTIDEEAKNKYIHNNSHEKLTHLVNSCGGNVVALNNLASDEIKEKQVKRLFKELDRIKESNKGAYFTNLAYQLVVSYIKNKYPQKLSEDSILLIKEAEEKSKLSEEQRQYFESILREATEPNEALTEKGETNNAFKKVQTGNLQIFDASTNARLCNEPEDIVNPFSSDASLSGIVCDLQRSVSFEISEVPGKTVEKIVNNEQTLPEENECSDSENLEEYESGSDQVGHKAQVRIPSSRKNRVFDLSSVRCEMPSPLNSDSCEMPSPLNRDSCEMPSQPVDEFKKRVNNDENAEELKGLHGYLKRAWRYCKLKVGSKCILL